MPYLSPLPPLYDDPWSIPEDPRRAAREAARRQAGYSLMATAGSPNYADSLARAFATYDQGQVQEMDRYRELAEQRRRAEIQQAQLERQWAMEERQQRLMEQSLEEADRGKRERSDEREYWLSLIPEGERGKYALAPTEAIKAAATPPKKKEPIRMDLGNREVLIDPDTYEEIKSFPQGSTGSGATRQPYRVDLGERISVRDPYTNEEIYSIEKDPEAAGTKRLPGAMTATQWMKILRNEDVVSGRQRTDMERAQEAEARAAGIYAAPPSRADALGTGARARADLRAGRFGGDLVEIPSQTRPPPVPEPIPGTRETAPTSLRDPRLAPAAEEISAVRAAIATSDEATVRTRLTRKGVPQERIEELIRLAGGG